MTPPTEPASPARIPSWRKWIVLFTVCWTALPVMFASNALFAATSAVASDLETTPTTIMALNSGVIVGMSLSHFIWGPVTILCGRKRAYIAALVLTVGCNAGQAVAPNLAAFGACWVLAGTTGAFFLITGQVIISDIFEPVKRGTAVGFFLGTCVFSNGTSPMVGGVIVSYTSWRTIYWLQFGMACLALILAVCFIPSKLRVDENGNKMEEEQGWSERPNLTEAFNPMEVFRQMKYPTVLFSNAACALLACSQYALLSSIPAAINPRFSLTTPLASSLFYLAPGSGFLVGSTIGGRFSDRTVKRWIKKRDGVRLPFDRLRASFGAVFIILPVGELVYSWTLQNKVGGLAVPVISAFVAGVGLMASFSALNTFAAGRV
ncbi:hypothetical protein FALCPG4_011398 [Fusarium falciforme]